MSSDEYTAVQKKEQCKNKIFSMDVGRGYAVTGHDKLLQLWSLSGGSVWERKPESLGKKSAPMD